MKLQMPMEVLKRKFLLMNKSTPLIIFVVIFFSNLMSSDGRLHLVHADKTSGRMVEKERIHVWSGSVHAYQDTVTMYCDSAVFYDDNDHL